MMDISIIGTIYQETGVMLTDEEGFEYPETKPVDGYHVNTTELPDSLAAYLTAPATPLRVFAGATTYHLKFADEAEFLSVMADYLPDQ